MNDVTIEESPTASMQTNLFYIAIAIVGIIVLLWLLTSYTTKNRGVDALIDSIHKKQGFADDDPV